MKVFGKFFKSFFYAGRGVASTVFRERNMRVHLVFAVYMFSILSLTDWFVLSGVEWAVLILAAALVLASELINTALEHVVDLVSGGKKSEHAKRAKDAAAGAVLIFACGAVAVGLKILFQKEAFRKMGDYFASHKAALVIFIISIIASLLFIYFSPKKKDA